MADPDPAPDVVDYNAVVDDLFGDGNIYTNEIDTPTDTSNNQEDSWSYTPDPTAPAPAPDFVTGTSGGGSSSDGGGGDSPGKIVCTEMYRQTQLDDWSRAIKIWDIYQRKYLSPQHEIGYHWLFKPYVKGMRKSSILTKLGAELASRRTQHLKHILTKGKAKDSLIGKIWCSIIHPIVGTVGRVLSLLNNVRGN